MQKDLTSPQPSSTQGGVSASALLLVLVVVACAAAWFHMGGGNRTKITESDWRPMHGNALESIKKEFGSETGSSKRWWSK